MTYRSVPDTVPTGEPVTFESDNAYHVEEMVNEVLARDTSLRLRGGLEYETLEGRCGRLVHRVTVTFVSKIGDF